MSTVDLVQRKILAGLLHGRFPPGTRMRQDELAERFGVSKIPVREALQRLAALGLLRFETNRGALVPHLCAADAEEVYALRRGLEPALLAQAIPQMTIVELAEAEVALTNPGDSIAASNWAFHQPLYRAAGWERGLAMAEVLHAAVAPYVLLYTTDLATPENDRREHLEILAACRRADVDLAVGLVTQHLDHAQQSLIDHLQTDGSTPA